MFVVFSVMPYKPLASLLVIGSELAGGLLLSEGVYVPKNSELKQN
jgi:hypothetical protein